MADEPPGGTSEAAPEHGKVKSGTRLSPLVDPRRERSGLHLKASDLGSGSLQVPRPSTPQDALSDDGVVHSAAATEDDDDIAEEEEEDNVVESDEEEGCVDQSMMPPGIYVMPGDHAVSPTHQGCVAPLTFPSISVIPGHLRTSLSHRPPNPLFGGTVDDEACGEYLLPSGPGGDYMMPDTESEGVLSGCEYLFPGAPGGEYVMPGTEGVVSGGDHLLPPASAGEYVTPGTAYFLSEGGDGYLIDVTPRSEVLPWATGSAAVRTSMEALRSVSGELALGCIVPTGTVEGDVGPDGYLIPTGTVGGAVGPDGYLIPTGTIVGDEGPDGSREATGSFEGDLGPDGYLIPTGTAPGDVGPDGSLKP